MSKSPKRNKPKERKAPQGDWGYPPEHHSKCAIHDDFCEMCFFSISAYQNHGSGEDKKGWQWFHEFNIMRKRINDSLDNMEIEFVKLRHVIEKNHWEELDI